MTVYISGPISKIEDGNQDAFTAAQLYFEAQGHSVLNPHQICEPLTSSDYWHLLSEDDKWTLCMKACVKRLPDADLLFALDGWNESRGALREVAIAEWLGIPIRYQTPPERILDRAQGLFHAYPPDHVFESGMGSSVLVPARAQ